MEQIRIYFLFSFLFICFIFGHHGIWGSQARDRIRATVETKLQLWQLQILNALCWARDQTWVPALPLCHSRNSPFRPGFGVKAPAALLELSAKERSCTPPGCVCGGDGGAKAPLW